jgi:uncharacterized protein (DUF58 family)
MQQYLRDRWLRWLERRWPARTQLQLSQRTIFILPSRSGWAFLAALLLLGIMAINYQNSLMYALVFWALSLFLVCILHSYRNLAGLQVRAVVTEPVFAGECAHFVLQLQAGSRARQALQVGWFDQPAQHWLDMAADSTAPVTLSCPSQRRGWLQAPRLRIETGFPLGLLVAWSVPRLQQRVLVYPQPLAAESLPLPQAAASADADSAAGVWVQGDDFRGWLAYQPAMSWRHLDWGRYARNQGLYVKQFASPAAPVRHLDYQQLSGDQEWRLAFLCRWVLILAQSDQPFSLSLPAVEALEGSGANQRRACLQALALFGVADVD